jgi:hypothetical protein
MHRAVLIAWLPLFLWMLAAVAALWCVLRFCGARVSFGKLRGLHRSEAGSVQTLSFVFTLPLFIMLLMFIVQVAELMVGIGVIHYAAFAAARAACVWLPAEVPPYEPANTVDSTTLDGDKSHYPEWISHIIRFNDYAFDRNWKYRKIWSAAAIACTPMSPSRDLAKSSQSSYVAEAFKALYPTLVPSSSKYPRISQLIQKKIDYSARNTWITINGIDRDGTRGPTYNPYPGHLRRGVEIHYVTGDGGQIDPVSEQPIEVWVPWKPNEIGWEDPITVTVWHSFALLPGPGRFLATVLKPADGTPDQVSPLIVKANDEQYKGEKDSIRMYRVVLTAAVTLSNEGLKSVLPYVQPND